MRTSRRRNKKTKKLRKKRPKIHEKQPPFCGCLLGPFLTIKLGIKKKLPFLNPRCEVTAFNLQDGVRAFFGLCHPCCFFFQLSRQQNNTRTTSSTVLELGSRLPGTRPEFLDFPRKSIGEGASSLFGRGPKSPQNISCSRATPKLHRCNFGVALEQEMFWGLFGPRPKRLLAPSPIDFRGNPGIRYFACSPETFSE